MDDTRDNSGGEPELFTCERMNARLTPGACAANIARAQAYLERLAGGMADLPYTIYTGDAEILFACGTCPRSGIKLPIDMIKTHLRDEVQRALDRILGEGAPGSGYPIYALIPCGSVEFKRQRKEEWKAWAKSREGDVNLQTQGRRWRTHESKS